MELKRDGYVYNYLGYGCRFKGIYIHVYNNSNGKYGFVELGANNSTRNLTRIEEELMEYLGFLSVDEFRKIEDTEDYETYKYSIDFVNVFKKSLEMV